MMLRAPLEDDWVRRERSRATYNGALLTALFVLGGAVLATVVLPPVPTPANVAKAYVNARFDRDWAAAWDLVCRPSREALGSYANYAEYADYWADRYRPPSDVSVSVGDLHGVPGGAGRSAIVTMSVTSDDRHRESWEVGGELTLVEEDGAFRVCGQGLVAG